MKSSPYLNFNGKCKEAFALCAELLGGEIIAMQTFADSPMAGDTPAEHLDKVMHAQLKIGEQVFMASDACQKYQQPQGFHIAIGVDTQEEAERIFNALCVGGDVIMPLEETFWAQRFATFTDRFGIPWMVNCDKPAQ